MKMHLLCLFGCWEDILCSFSRQIRFWSVQTTLDIVTDEISSSIWVQREYRQTPGGFNFLPQLLSGVRKLPKLCAKLFDKKSHGFFYSHCFLSYREDLFTSGQVGGHCHKFSRQKLTDRSAHKSPLQSWYEHFPAVETVWGVLCYSSTSYRFVRCWFCRTQSPISQV